MEKSKVNSVDRQFIRNTLEELQYRVDISFSDRVSLSKLTVDAMIEGLGRIG